MRRRLASAALLCTLSVVASACTANGNAPLEGEIPIGVSIEQSGDSKVLGQAELRAIQLVADQINVKGVLGKRIKLVIEDNAGRPDKAKATAESLISQGVAGIVGPGTSSAAQGALDLVEEKQMPMVTMGAADGLVTGRQYVFKTPPNGATVVEVLIKELVSSGTKTVGILAVDNPYGSNSLAAIQKGVSQAGLSVVNTKRFPESAGAKDLQDPVDALVASKPDVVVVSSIMPWAAYAATAFKSANYKGRIFFDSGAGADLFIKGAKDSSENTFMIQHQIIAADHTTATTPSLLAQKEFFAAYTQRYGEFSGYASYAADALNILVAAIRKANSTDHQQVRDALESLKWDGLTGSFEFGPKNHGGAEGDGLAVLTVQKGAWVLAP
ncbi:MAG: branched amino acid binding secreted protein [Actinomycetia bacterium]|nr:branched amino acid binding secreted protein [Actinomycetes bacterium]MDQ1651189.1 branched-chain amino acid transport system substrate-binding protein [Cryptosporangiaceae bacterium]